SVVPEYSAVVHPVALNQMWEADRRAEVDLPGWMGKGIPLAHDAARVGIMCAEICANIVFHVKPVAHLVRRDAAVVRWGQCHLAVSIGATVNPELRPLFISPIGAGRGRGL